MSLSSTSRLSSSAAGGRVARRLSLEVSEAAGVEIFGGGGGGATMGTGLARFGAAGAVSDFNDLVAVVGVGAAGVATLVSGVEILGVGGASTGAGGMILGGGGTAGLVATAAVDRRAGGRSSSTCFDVEFLVFGLALTVPPLSRSKSVAINRDLGIAAGGGFNGALRAVPLFALYFGAG